MKKFTIEVTETLVRLVEVAAKDEEGALKEVRKQYNEEKIVLDYSDFLEHDLKIFNEK